MDTTVKVDYYEVLGITKNASDEEVKRAYKKMALTWHPDRNRSRAEEATTMFKLVAEAYEILGNAEARRIYDQYGHAGLKGELPRSGFEAGSFANFGFPNSFGTAFGFPAGFGPGPGPSFHFHDPFEIFNSFFGSQNPFGHHFNVAGDPFSAHRQLHEQMMQQSFGVPDLTSMHHPAGFGSGFPSGFGQVSSFSSSTSTFNSIGPSVSESTQVKSINGKRIQVRTRTVNDGKGNVTTTTEETLPDGTGKLITTVNGQVTERKQIESKAPSLLE